MTPEAFIDVMRETIYVLLLISAPPMLVALVIGLIISLFQALTQIQETTLTFVPKIVAMLLTLIIAMPFIVDKVIMFNERIFERVANIE